MSDILDFFTSGPARVKQLLIGALVLVAVCAVLLCYGLYWRGEAMQARGERDLALAQVEVVSAAAKACSSSVDQAKRVGDAAVAAGAELLAAARRIKQPIIQKVERIERVIHDNPPTPEQAADCSWGWDLIEQQSRKAGGP